MNDASTGVRVSFSQCLCLSYLFLNRPFLNFLSLLIVPATPSKRLWQLSEMHIAKYNCQNVLKGH